MQIVQAWHVLRNLSEGFSMNSWTESCLKTQRSQALHTVSQNIKSGPLYTVMDGYPKTWPQKKSIYLLFWSLSVDCDFVFLSKPLFPSSSWRMIWIISHITVLWESRISKASPFREWGKQQYVCCFRQLSIWHSDGVFWQWSARGK